MIRHWQKVAGLASLLALFLLPNAARAQSTPESTMGSFWITPYLGVGFQGEYYDDFVQFSDGGTDFLTIDSRKRIVFGVEMGYRLQESWSLRFNLGTASPDAQYVEDLSLRPEAELKTTQFEMGLLYDLGTFPVGDKVAPFQIGGGLSATFHSLDRFSWDGGFINPRATSFGVHGLAAVDIPLGPKLSLRGQGKLSVTPLSFDDLEDKISAAEGGGVKANLESHTMTDIVFSVGLSIRP